jgi:hypothetical protein
VYVGNECISGVQSKQPGQLLRGCKEGSSRYLTWKRRIRRTNIPWINTASRHTSTFQKRWRASTRHALSLLPSICCRCPDFGMRGVRGGSRAWCKPCSASDGTPGFYHGETPGNRRGFLSWTVCAQGPPRVRYLSSCLHMFSEMSLRVMFGRPKT